MGAQVMAGTRPARVAPAHDRRCLGVRLFPLPYAGPDRTPACRTFPEGRTSVRAHSKPYQWRPVPAHEMVALLVRRKRSWPGAQDRLPKCNLARPFSKVRSLDLWPAFR